MSKDKEPKDDAAENKSVSDQVEPGPTGPAEPEKKKAEKKSAPPSEERDPLHPWVWLKTGEKAFLTRDLIAEVDQWDSKTGRAKSPRAEDPAKVARWRTILQEYEGSLESRKQHAKEGS